MYALRMNLNVAIVAMVTAKNEVTDDGVQTMYNLL